MNGAGPLVHEINAAGGKVVVVGQNAHLTFADGRTASRLFVGVPPRPEIFVGRDELVAGLRSRVKGGGVVALTGTGGVGKTTLATALAWDADLLAHFSGGVLWASLGLSPNADELLNRWAEAIGLDVAQEPTTEQRAARIQARLGGRSFLFVLDDVWQESSAELLCRITAPGCAYLLTTRDQKIAAHLASGSPLAETAFSFCQTAVNLSNSSNLDAAQRNRGIQWHRTPGFRYAPSGLLWLRWLFRKKGVLTKTAKGQFLLRDSHLTWSVGPGDQRLQIALTLAPLGQNLAQNMFRHARQFFQQLCMDADRQRHRLVGIEQPWPAFGKLLQQALGNGDVGFVRDFEIGFSGGVGHLGEGSVIHDRRAIVGQNR